MRHRIRYSKLGKIRFLSHRDLARVWERGLRRSGIRVAYSEGFSPRPRLSFGLALSTGYESLGEYVDVDLHPEAGIDPVDIPSIVTPNLPPGIEAQAIRRLDPGAESLQSAVTSSTWRLSVVGAAPATARSVVQQALAADELPIVVERKGSEMTVDARPGILALEVTEVSEPGEGVSALHPTVTLTAELATQPRSLRPAELVRALDPTWREARVLRTHQWTTVDGARCEPIPLGDTGAGEATSTPHDRARAS